MSFEGRRLMDSSRGVPLVDSLWPPVSDKTLPTSEERYDPLCGIVEQCRSGTLHGRCKNVWFSGPKAVRGLTTLHKFATPQLGLFSSVDPPDFGDFAALGTCNTSLPPTTKSDYIAYPPLFTCRGSPAASKVPLSSLLSDCAVDCPGAIQVTLWPRASMKATVSLS